MSENICISEQEGHCDREEYGDDEGVGDLTSGCGYCHCLSAHLLLTLVVPLAACESPRGILGV